MIERLLCCGHIFTSQINSAWMRHWGHWECSRANQETLPSCHGINPPSMQLSCVCCESASPSNVCSSLSFTVQYFSVSSHCVSVLINKSNRSCSRLGKKLNSLFPDQMIGTSGSSEEHGKRGLCIIAAVIYCSKSNKQWDLVDGKWLQPCYYEVYNWTTHAV